MFKCFCENKKMFDEGCYCGAFLGEKILKMECSISDKRKIANSEFTRIIESNSGTNLWTVGLEHYQSVLDVLEKEEKKINDLEYFKQINEEIDLDKALRELEIEEETWEDLVRSGKSFCER